MALPFAVGAAAPTAAVDAADSPVEGHWQAREVDFNYLGFTTQYSCDGLGDKLRLLLLAAGARADARVVPYGCEQGRIARFPRARLAFHVLVAGEPPPAMAPADPARSDGPPARRIGRESPKMRRDPPPPQPGAGAWRTVEFGPNQPRGLAPGDCELVEQFARQVLPLMTVRDVENEIRCVPYQLTGSSPRIAFTSLAGLPEADARR